jgi:hypothetical protein
MVIMIEAEMKRNLIAGFIVISMNFNIGFKILIKRIK